jgi:hypothetical protein
MIPKLIITDERYVVIVPQLDSGSRRSWRSTYLRTAR